MTGYQSKDNVEWICLTCKLDIYKDLVPKLSVKNKMGFPEKLEELCLFPLEEILITPLIPFMTLRALPVCGLRTHGQKSIMGNVVHVPNDVSSTVQSLPRLLDDMGTVPMKLKRRMCYSTSVFLENVRPLKSCCCIEIPHAEQCNVHTNQLPGAKRLVAAHCHEPTSKSLLC